MVDTTGVPSVQATPEQRERNNLTSVQNASQQSGGNPSTSPLSVGTAEDTSRKTETAQVALASYKKSEVHVFLKGIPHIISEGHAKYLLERRQTEVEYDTTAVPTVVQIGVTASSRMSRWPMTLITL